MPNQEDDSRYWRIWQLVSLGRLCQELSCCGPDAENLSVCNGLRVLIAELDRLSLRNCHLWASEELARLASRLERRSKAGEATLDADAARLHQMMVELQVRVEQESSTAYAYPVRPSRPCDAQQLIRNPYLLLPLEQPVYNLLPKLAPHVLEAGRCFAVGFYWAAAYFMLVAVEIVYKEYWGRVMQRKPHPRATWGKLNDQLVGVKPIVLSTARDIIQNYRNPIMHGTVSEITPDEVISLLNDCRELVSEILADGARWWMPEILSTEMSQPETVAMAV